MVSAENRNRGCAFLCKETGFQKLVGSKNVVGSYIKGTPWGPEKVSFSSHFFQRPLLERFNNLHFTVTVFGATTEYRVTLIKKIKNTGFIVVRN